MCGIFGVIAKQNSLSGRELLGISNELFRLSESRGKESAGVAVLTDQSITIHKEPHSASKMIQGNAYKNLMEELLSPKTHKNDKLHFPVSLMGHSRLVTNGSQERYVNNQPVIKNAIVGIHNGIIVNDERLWQGFPMLQREYEVDTEIMLSLINHFYAMTNSLVSAVQSTFQIIEGTASTAIMFKDFNIMMLATNNGSLYACADKESGLYVFASEQYILRQLANHRYFKRLLGNAGIEHIEPGFGCMIDLQDVHCESFSLGETDEPAVVPGIGFPRTIIETSSDTPDIPAITPPTLAPTPLLDPVGRRFSPDVKSILALRRCKRCVLPETVPFITFDEQGICNYCHDYQKREHLGKEALDMLVNPYRRSAKGPDCLVMLSGGRDSCYGLHYVTNVLKLHPVAYTYDWGMITDLARRNQARLCGKLGIEHIIVSADINEKRRYIRQNVVAWLKRPHLGMVPLFMAGDKQWYYYANKVGKQVGVDLTVLATNPLEETYFKNGFCGDPPLQAHNNALPLSSQARLFAFYMKELLLNPAYLNDSLFDSTWAFASFYMIPHDYLRLYRYIVWDEEEVSSTLIGEYDWELAKDTQTTWRIGDGTAAFYNYIYYAVAGFSENDTFRSNQIREGVLTREKAMDIVNKDNQPRFESIQWYCDTIGIDMVSTLERINTIPKLYPAIS